MVPEINVVDDDKNYKEEQGFKVSDSLRTSASPKVRKFARELGVNINQVPGSERQGRVTEVDIKNFVFSKKNTPEIKEKKTKSYFKFNTTICGGMDQPHVQNKTTTRGGMDQRIDTLPRVKLV